MRNDARLAKINLQMQSIENEKQEKVSNLQMLMQLMKTESDKKIDELERDNQFETEKFKEVNQDLKDSYNIETKK